MNPTKSAAKPDLTDRLPPEIWVHILRQAFDASESWPYDTTSRMRTLTAAWSRDETFLSDDGQRQRCIWRWRLVSHSWNQLLLPLLFESLVLWGSPQDTDWAGRMMSRCIGVEGAGRFVRHLTFRFDAPEEGWPVDEVAPQIHEIIRLCPNMRELLWIAADDLPASLVPVMRTSSVRKLHFRDWQDNPPGPALLEFAAAIPSLEVLAIVEAAIDMDGVPLESIQHRVMPNLQHIALRVANANAAFIRALGSFDLPRLTSVIGDAYQSADIDALHPLLLYHGKYLRKLVLLYPHAPKSYASELSLLALCPMLEEYVTHLPIINSQPQFPDLPRLRRIGLFGFVPATGSFSEPLHPHERQEWWDEKKDSHQYFFDALDRTNFPELESITLFDLAPMEVRNWTNYVYRMVVPLANRWEVQGIRLENADGEPVKQLVMAGSYRSPYPSGMPTGV